ncbi:MAG TPA: TIGR04283 family arsenosugar biosynthesis glycosyltransferase [Candidatus Binataceae bacterium]|jgi:rSAM/selenodomain-associated transferase 2|nr:TIGR04283 family arsenosugar biosynthesis glycosyltransferase [Candidatus Binataceae bacterium]
MTLSVIVPMLNEERTIVAALRAIRVGAPDGEIIVVDGRSTDLSCRLAQAGCDRLIEAQRGRARQMNAGAALTAGEVLSFVHADTIVPPEYAQNIELALADPEIVGGWFEVELDDPAPLSRSVGLLINIRSRVWRVAAGGQAIFVRRDIFERLGGFREIEIWEDLEFSRRLKRVGRIACLKPRVLTSARRWKRDGIIQTAARIGTLRMLYLLGVRPALLKRFYTDCR